MNEHYILDVASQKGKIDWPGAIQRSGAFPLDRSSVFSSLADAEVYIQGLPNDSRGLGATSYAGQFISVYDEITKQVYPYLVQFTQNPDGSLKRILTRVLLTGDAISSDPNTNGGSSLDDTSWFIVDGGSAFDAIYRLHNAVCSIRCIDQDTQEVLYTAEPLNGYYFTAYNINNDNTYYIAVADVSSIVEKLNWPNSDLYTFVGVNSAETTLIDDNYIINGGVITYNYRKTSNTRLGDVNRDGFINNTDAKDFSDWVGQADINDYDPIYDLNSDGHINGADYAVIKQQIAEFSEEVPTVYTVEHILDTDGTRYLLDKTEIHSIYLVAENEIPYAIITEGSLDAKDFSGYRFDHIENDSSLDTWVVGDKIPNNAKFTLIYVVDETVPTKTVSYTVTHCKYDEPIETHTYSATVPIDTDMVPVELNSLVSKAGTGEFIGYTLADFIPYNTATEILDGTEVVINYVKFGDVNRDNEINTEDLTAFENWFSTAGEEDYEPIYDLDRDGYVTGVDYALLKELVQ